MSSPRPRASESSASSSTVRQHETAPEASSAATQTPDDEDENGQEGNGGGDLPMSMTASVILTNLPKDAGQALKEVDEIDNHKVSVRFQPIGSAPILKQRLFKISASSKFSVVLNFLRKKLGIKEGDGLFLYVNSVFAPGLDEGVGNLFRVQSEQGIESMKVQIANLLFDVLFSALKQTIN
ncbi:Ubiquitin-like protein ATG12 [Exophiala dermatitidis]